MLYRPLGKTGLQISEIGLGCASYWGKKNFDAAVAIKLVHRAVSEGVTFFDTGSSYSGGNAEPRLGQALAGISNKHDLVIATKAGTCIGAGGRLYKDFTPQGLRSSVENSLRNLGLDTLPIFHLHGPHVGDLTDDTLGALENLRSEGKFRFLSVNSFDPPVIEHVMNLPHFSAVMIDYNILRPERAALIDWLAAKGLGIFAGMALAGGLYSRKIFRPKAVRDLWYLLRALKNHRADLRRGMQFRFLEAQGSSKASRIALSWVLHNRHISCAVLGTTRMEHLIDNLAASGYGLEPAMLQAITEAQKNNPGI